MHGFMLSETEVRELYAQGKAAMVGDFLELQRQVVVLAGQMAESGSSSARTAGAAASQRHGYGKPSGNANRR